MEITGPEVGVAGYYTFLLNGVPVFDAPSKNLITDAGWTRLVNLGSSAISGAAVQVGTSNTTPVVTDVALGALLATKITAAAGVVTNGSDTNGTYVGVRFAFAFTQGAVVGNVAEVGFKVASGDASLTSRSLVKDGLGNPAIIVVGAIDQLTVQYELRYYLNRTYDVTSNVLVAGVSTACRVASASQVSVATTHITGYAPTAAVITSHGTGFSFGAVGADSSGGGQVGDFLSLSSVVTNPALSKVTAVISYTTAQGNRSGGIFGIMLDFQIGGQGSGQLGNWKVAFTPAIPKDNTKTLAFAFTINLVRI